MNDSINSLSSGFLSVAQGFRIPVKSRLRSGLLHCVPALQVSGKTRPVLLRACQKTTQFDWQKGDEIYECLDQAGSVPAAWGTNGQTRPTGIGLHPEVLREAWLIKQFPVATRIVTPYNDPIAHSIEEYQTFLLSLGYESVAKAAFGKRVT